MKRLIIATTKSWNIENARKLSEKFKNSWNLTTIADKEKLTYETIKDINPEYIFFPHWSWKIPEEIFNNFCCIVFHMTDLPFGRGGSPLQNLIVRKVYSTKISAIEVRQEIDGGDILLKRDISIKLGNAEEIFYHASEIIFFDMIPTLVETNPVPTRQQGDIVLFQRRKPEESNLSEGHHQEIFDFYDFIRMLDAEGYPQAFIRIGNFKITFSEAHLKIDKIVGRFQIVKE